MQEPKYDDYYAEEPSLGFIYTGEWDDDDDDIWDDDDDDYDPEDFYFTSDDDGPGPESPLEYGYEVVLRFTAENTWQEIAGWVQRNIAPLVDEDMIIEVKQLPKIIDVERLTAEHYGSKVRVHVEGRDVEGTLQSVFAAGGTSGHARVLVIDGKAWTVNYGAVQVNVF